MKATILKTIFPKYFIKKESKRFHKRIEKLEEQINGIRRMRLIDADETLKRIADKSKKSDNLDVINGLCGATAIIYDMLIESGQESEDEEGISTSKLNEAQRTLYYIAENMKMDKSISEEGYRHFQMAIKALEQEPQTGHWIVYADCEGKTRRCVCDRCGHKTGEYTWKNPNYCSNCGARMESEE
jgi:hypothetical protein